MGLHREHTSLSEKCLSTTTGHGPWQVSGWAGVQSWKKDLTDSLECTTIKGGGTLMLHIIHIYRRLR